MTLPITGALTQNASRTGTPLALALPVVPKSALDDMDHVVNDTGVSGKAPGGLYLAFNDNDDADDTNDIYTIVTAAGTDVTDPWITVGGTTRVVYTTPA